MGSDSKNCAQCTTTLSFEFFVCVAVLTQNDQMTTTKTFLASRPRSTVKVLAKTTDLSLLRERELSMPNMSSEQLLDEAADIVQSAVLVKHLPSFQILSCDSRLVTCDSESLDMKY